MEKLIKINNDIYLLMQDIVQLIDRHPHLVADEFMSKSKKYLNIQISLGELIFFPNSVQLKKALLELKFLFSDWIQSNSETTELIYFITNVSFTKSSVNFHLPMFIYNQLKQVDFNLSKYIDNFTE